MAQPSLEDMREGALAALTFVEASLRSDTTSGSAEHDVILSAFKRAEIEAGALVLVHLLLAFEAGALEIPVAERIEQVRKLVRSGTFEP